MLVTNIESKSNDDYCELTAKIETDALKEPFSLWYRFPVKQKEFIDAENGDPFLAVSLLPAMKLGEPLQVTASCSERLFDSASKLQMIYHGWDQTLSEIPINVPIRNAESDQGNKESNVGLFFSLGVDSFYTLLRNSTAHPRDQDAITHLISVHGFDIYYGRGNTAVFADVLRASTKVAETLNKKTLPVATNVRDFSDQFVTWGRLCHGAAMASVGLALRHMFKTIYVAASYSHEQLFPWGSHPLLDPLWSTEDLHFLHDGGEGGRPSKIRFIAQFPIAMETLRVCYSNPNNEYNCGRCEKCLRTMIGLHIAGALRNCKTFPKQIDLETVQNFSINQIERPFAQELLENLGSSTLDLAIGAALRHALSRGLIQENVESKLHEIAARRLTGVVATNDERFFDQNKNDDYYTSVLDSVKTDLELVGHSHKGSMLDVGCGCGTFVKVCRNSGIESIGIEPDKDFIDIAKLQNVRDYVVRGVGEYLPFREGAFDIVTSMSVLEHVHSPRKVLQESVRVLKSRGVLWLSFPDYSRCFHEAHYGLFWIPLMPKRAAKAYVRMRGRTNTKYLDSIQYVTQRAVRNDLKPLKVRTSDLRKLRANNLHVPIPKTNDIRTRIREYCLERISSLDEIQTKRWRRIVKFLRWAGFGDGTLCRLCELFCQTLSFREGLSYLKQTLRRRLLSLTSPLREKCLPIKGNVIMVIEKES